MHTITLTFPGGMSQKVYVNPNNIIYFHEAIIDGRRLTKIHMVGNDSINVIESISAVQEAIKLPV